MLEKIMQWLPPARDDANSIREAITVQLAADKRAFEKSARAAGASRSEAAQMAADYFKTIDCTQSNNVAQFLCRFDNSVPVDACTTVIDGPDGILPNSAA